MGFLDNLVVGVDGSAASTAALRWGAERTDTTGTVHAVYAMASRGGGLELPLKLDELGLRWRADRAIKQYWSDPNSGRSHTIVTHLLQGDPARVMLGIAKEVEAAAIVVGPHSSPIHRWTIGSATRKLVQQSPVPIIVVIEGDEADLTQAETARPVVSCIGYGHATEEAAMWAAHYAAKHDLPLSLLHVVSARPLFPASSPTEMLSSYLGSDISEDWAKEDLREIQLRIGERWPDLETEAKVDFGASVPAILSAAANAELVVLGKRHWNAVLRAIISPRIHRVMANSETAVAVIPSCETNR